jgi:hypothetical protein
MDTATSISTSPRRVGRSIFAVLAGFIVVVALSIGTDEFLRVAGIFPALGQPMSNSLFLLATIYRTIYGVLGAYITARLSPYLPMRHALIGGAIGFVLSIVGVAMAWNHPEFGPHWYPVALVVTALPSAWLGGKLAGDRDSATASR